MYLVVLAAMRFRNQEVDITARNICFVVPEHILCSAIEALNGALAVNDDDGIDSGVHQCVECIIHYQITL